MKIKLTKKLTIITALSITLLIGSYFVAANYGFFGGGTNAPSVPEDTMTRGLVGYWEFDEGTGQTAYDGSDSSNNGQLGSTASSDDNDPSWTASGKNGGGMEFDGVDDYVNAGSGASLKPVNVTYELWFNTNVSTGQWIINKYQELSEGWGIRIASNVSIYDDINNDDTTRYATAINTGQWYHVVATMNNLENKLYLDGVLIGSGESSTGNFASFSGTTYFGQRGNATNYFNGSIDSVRIYNRALSADEVRYHYNRGGPVGIWNFDEGSGLTAYDSTENNNDGTLKSSGLEFDGVDDYVDCGDVSVTEGISALSVETWVKGDTWAYGAGIWSGIVVKRVPGGEGPFSLNVRASDASDANKISFSVRNSSDAMQNANADSVLDTTLFHHIVGTWDGTTVRLYIDNVLQADTGSISGVTDSTSQALYVGASRTFAPIEHFNGSIDEVRIYNTALSAEEIARHYNNDFSQDPTAN
ncbi:MAG: LamG domain-containing protein, partial [Candidatus Pacebacteria bacterium]|nr:LamG domain-containing protein [Candidatus Paceibacterota bacterium]